MKRSLTEENGRLLARWRAGQAAHPGKLDDYAFCAWGLLELYGVTFRTAYLAEAGDLTARLLEQFFDGKNGGFYPYAADGEQLITRTKETYDGAMPSGNAAAALVLSRLARLTGEARWRTAADLQLGSLAGATRTYPAGHGFALLVFLEELWPSAELVCAARTMPEELAAFLREASRPCLLYTSKVRRWMGMQIFYFSHAGDVDHAWAASRSVEELDVVVGNHVQAKKQYDTWTEEDEAGYQIYLQEQDMEKRTYRAWYLIANPRKLPKEIVNQELAFRFKLFPDKMDKKK